MLKISTFYTCLIFTIFFFALSDTNNLSAQNIIVTVAGDGEFGYSGDGGKADTATLAAPEGVCLDKQGNMYIADAGNNVIRKVAAATGIISTIAGTGTAGYTGDGGLPDTATLDAPAAVFADDSGNIFIADWGNNVIREIVDSNGTIITVAGNGNAGFNDDSIPATQAELWGPSAVYVDKAGNIYIADTYNHRIRKVDVNGIISTVAGDSIEDYTGDGGLADTASLYAPYGVVVDTAGNIYIADTTVIRKVTASTGIISTIAGARSGGYSGDGGPAVNALLNGPEGICLDKNQNLYIADYYNNVVRVINAQTNIISTIAGSDTIGYWGDGGLADTSRLNGPTGVFVTDSGFLYIADFNNNRIREVGPGLVQWTGVSEVADAGFSIFPNPSDGHFTVKTGGGNDLTLFVYNSLGQQIYQAPIRENLTTVNMANEAGGIYVVRLQTADASYTQKIVVSRN